MSKKRKQEEPVFDKEQFDREAKKLFLIVIGMFVLAVLFNLFMRHFLR